NVAILNWSPTIRGLLKRKRKSVGKKDEEEDGRRAIVVDEGVTALIFSYAKDMEFFQSVDKVPSELLNMIKIFVRGYEVEKCSPALWNHAIIEGYKVFRDVKEHLEGTVKIDTVERKISFEPRKR
ncbi:MAG: hypothetical protein ORO03_08360, partial [Alphaproteobacteria bacterium]|nr:hypothetical protein [Alphaproteobacteria bacterium]